MHDLHKLHPSVIPCHTQMTTRVDLAYQEPNESTAEALNFMEQSIPPFFFLYMILITKFQLILNLIHLRFNLSKAALKIILKISHYPGGT